MAFIGRPNLPEGLIQQIMQLQASRNIPALQGMESGMNIAAQGLMGIGRHQAAGKEKDRRLEAEKDKQFMGTLWQLAAGGLLSLPGAPSPGGGMPGMPSPAGFATAGLWSAMGRKGPAPGPVFQINPRKKEPDLSKITITAQMAKKYPGLVEDSQVPSTFLADFDEKLKDRDFQRQMKGYDLSIKQADLAIKKEHGKEHGEEKALNALFRARTQIVSDLKTVSDPVAETVLRHRMSQVDDKIGASGLPGFGTQMEKDLRTAEQAISLGLIAEEEAHQELVKKYPQLEKNFKKKGRLQFLWQAIRGH